MYKYLLIGYRQVSMTSQDGNPIKGFSLFFGSEISSSVGQGHSFLIPRGKHSSLFLSEEEFYSLDIEIGSLYTFSFNQYGSIIKDSIVKLSSK